MDNIVRHLVQKYQLDEDHCAYSPGQLIQRLQTAPAAFQLYVVGHGNNMAPELLPGHENPQPNGGPERIGPQVLARHLFDAIKADSRVRVKLAMCHGRDTRHWKSDRLLRQRSTIKVNRDGRSKRITSSFASLVALYLAAVAKKDDDTPDGAFAHVYVGAFHGEVVWNQGPPRHPNAPRKRLVSKGRPQPRSEDDDTLVQAIHFEGGVAAQYRHYYSSRDGRRVFRSHLPGGRGSNPNLPMYCYFPFAFAKTMPLIDRATNQPVDDDYWVVDDL